MRRRRNKMILIIIILLVILTIVAGIGVFAYFKTDIFKSNKQLFFKYLAQNVEIMNIIKDEDLLAYFKQEKEMPFENNGDIKMQVSGTQQDELLNAFKIDFKGKSDGANNLKEQNVILDYGNNIVFPVQYKRADNVYAIKSEYIGQNYIGIKDDGVIIENYSLEDIKKIDANHPVKEAFITMSSMSNTELENLIQTYGAIIYDSIDKSKFSKTKNGYQLELSITDLGNIVPSILEKVKQDENLKNMWLEKDLSKTQKDWEDGIESLIESSKETLKGEETIVIAVDVDNGKLKSTKIISKFNIALSALENQNVENEFSVTLGIKENQMDVNLQMAFFQQEYNININLMKQKDDNLEYIAQCIVNIDGEESSKVNLVAKYIGLEAKQNVTENYTIEGNLNKNNLLINNFFETNFIEPQETSEKATMKYTFATTKTFADNIPFTPLTNENMLLVNDLGQEEQMNIFKALIDRWFFVSGLQMEELNVNEVNNPVYFLYPKLKEMDAENMKPNNTIGTSGNEQTIEMYNSRLKSYQGEKQGTIVKSFLDTLNAIYQEQTSSEGEASIKTIEVDGQSFDGTPENYNALKEQIQEEKTYEIAFEYGAQNGIIEKVNIQTKENVL